MAKGYVYLLTNEAMPGYVKIGFTERTVEERIEELSKPTGVPMPFDCFSPCELKTLKVLRRKFMMV